MEQQRPFTVGKSVIPDSSGFGRNQARWNGLLPSNQLHDVGVERHAVETRTVLAGEALEMFKSSLLFKHGGITLQCVQGIEDARATAG